MVPSKNKPRAEASLCKALRAEGVCWGAWLKGLVGFVVANDEMDVAGDAVGAKGEAVAAGAGEGVKVVCFISGSEEVEGTKRESSSFLVALDAAEGSS